jgi:ketosteroid isomerase-like protein
MLRFVLALFVVVGLSSTGSAQAVETPADHDALRKLKDSVVEAINRRDYATAKSVLHEPFMATVVTQDSFTDFDKLKAYFEGLYTRDTLKMKSIKLSAEADDLSKIFQGTFALSKGSTKEHYELADGRIFDLDGRWTAVSLKEGDTWKILAVHMGANFLDNPVLDAIERSVVWVGVGCGVVGLLAGFAIGWLGRRRRDRAASASVR